MGTRRDFITGAAALAAFSQIKPAKALVGSRRALLGGAGIPSWVPNHGNPPDFAINWKTNQVWQKGVAGFITPAAFGIGTVRASSATDLLYTSASGYAYNTYGSNVTVISPNVGRLTFEARSNLFLSPTAPATQTITLSATGSYTLWCNGSGSAAIVAGTATITGAGTSTNGTPVTINCTATGTVTVTITGSLQAVQLEAGASATSFIVAGSRAADVTTVGSLSGGSAYTLFEAATSPLSAYTASQIYLMFSLGGSVSSSATTGRQQSTNDYFTSVNNAAYAVSTTPISANSPHTVAASFSGTSQSAYIDGVLANTGALTTPTGLNTITFGSQGSFNWLNGIATKDAIWLTQAIPNAQLQGLQ